MTYFAVTQIRGENWDRSRSMREQQLWDEHAQCMDALVDDGFIVLGGPLDDGEKVLLIVNSSDEYTIAERFAPDPWTAMRLRIITDIERWDILLGTPPR